MCAFMLLLSLVVCCAPARSATPNPNILLIISDDQAWTDYSFLGHPHIRTPHLDRLASQSLVFPRGYVTSSLCCPSLASILTGRYPHQHKITSNDPPMPAASTRAAAYKDPLFSERREQVNALLDAVPTLPKVLGQHRYLSLQTGKWWLGNYRRGGFTHGMTDGDPLRGGRHGDEGLKIGRQTLQPIYDFIEMATKENQPFFIWYAPMLPHAPHNPPERLLAKYRGQTPSLHIARYWAMVEWFDETCGELLDYLDRRNLADNTIVAYLADNGWIQSTDKPDYAPKSKQSPYDGGLRTPIMIRWPGQVKPQQSSAPASSIDLAPTLLRAAGIEPPPGLPGLNLLDTAAVGKRDIIFGECFTHDFVEIQIPAKNLRWRWCLENDWKLIVPDSINEPKAGLELYNLAADPHEERNLAASESNRVTRLERRLNGWWDGK